MHSAESAAVSTTPVSGAKSTIACSVVGTSSKSRTRGASNVSAILTTDHAIVMATMAFATGNFVSMLAIVCHGHCEKSRRNALGPA